VTDRKVIQRPAARTDRRPGVLGPGLLLGAGLGGFVDGIALHQILQWHHMISSTDDNPVTTLAGLEANTLADGLFHAAAWLAVVAGVAWLWRRVADQGPRWSGTALTGAIIAGWGAFNLADGIVNHLLLEVHHVRTDTGNVRAWDLGFLALAALLLLAGLLMHHRAKRRA
jgi:uncharacterized membrane protein